MGEHVEQNLFNAFTYFNESAYFGYAPSRRMLGFFYSHGLIVPKDEYKSLVWYSLASLRGDLIASHFLAYRFWSKYNQNPIYCERSLSYQSHISAEER